MNYGKKNVSKRQQDISSKKNMKKKRIGVRFFKALVICVLLLMILGVVGVGVFAKKIIDNTPDVSPNDVKPSGYTTFVYAPDGTELERLVSSGSNRIYKTIDEIPENLAHAFVAIEDERFYTHNGIDMQGILRAGVVGITSGGNFSEGASTLTQQLIKNNVFPNFTDEKTFYDRLERKLQEQVLAIEIEKQMSKEEIVEAYMNTINLGQNCLGVQSAAQRYFSKNVNDLSLSECAVIAAITQNPTEYDPVVYPEENAKRRERVLKNMLEQDYIDQAQYDEAIADPVYERIQTSVIASVDDAPYSYFIDELTKQVITDLREQKGYTYTQAYNALYSGGLTIRATQDPGIQAICDEEVANPANYPDLTEYGLEYAATIYRADGTTVENYSVEMLRDYLAATRGDQYPLVFSTPEAAQQAVDEYKSTLNIGEGDTIDESVSITLQPQTSVVIMDQYTGQVKAMVGGRGTKETSLSLNRATNSTRQPGSCFKVLSAYAPALDAAGYTLASTIVDEPYTYTNGKPVNNWDHRYIGTTTVRYAIEHSMNVCAVKTLTDIGLQTGYDYLTNFGFTTLVDGTDENYPGYSDIAQATALGGITRGIYNMEMTAAYAAIANNGTYTKPILYTEILDHDGEVLLQNTPKTHQVIQDSTAGLLTNAMQDVVTRGTGTTARLSNMPVSGKTGTTSDNVDIWFSAYTPYYTCSVWGGYDTNKPLREYDTAWHMVIWRNIMDRVHAALPYKDFTLPPSVEQKTTCTQTGLLAVSGCPSITEYFATGTVPTQSCPGHRSATPPSDSSSDSSNTDSSNTENNGETNNGETNNGETNNGETNNGETNNGETNNGENGSGETNGGNIDSGLVPPA